MSNSVSSYVWEGFPEGGSKMIVVLALADWSNDDGGSIYPSVNTLALKTRLSDRQVQRILRELEEEGFLRVVGNHDGGKPGTTRQYHLNVEKLEELSLARKALRRASKRTGDIRDTRDSSVTPGVTSVSPNPSDYPSTSTTPERDIPRTYGECTRARAPKHTDGEEDF